MKEVQVQETSFGTVNDAYDGDDQDTNDGAPKEHRSVSTKELFRFCGKRERFLIIVGTIGAIIHGAAFPTMIIFYGSMTESFVQWNICDEMVSQIECHTNLNVSVRPEECQAPVDPIWPDQVACLDGWCSDTENTFDLLYRLSVK